MRLGLGPFHALSSFVGIRTNMTTVRAATRVKNALRPSSRMQHLSTGPHGSHTPPMSRTLHRAAVATSSVAPGKDRKTHCLHRDEVDAMRKEAGRLPHGAHGSLLFAVVEGIHDKAEYDAYAGVNSAAFSAFADKLTILCRQYADEMDCFQVLHCSAGVGAGPVDRMPVVFCDTADLLAYVSSEAYTEKNVQRRHASSGHCNAYVGSGIDPAWLVGFRDRLSRGTPKSFVTFECFRPGDRGSAVQDALLAAGAQLVFATARGAAPRLHVLEGTVPDHVALFQLDSWAAALELRRACAAALVAFEASGGAGRLIAFSG